MKNQIKNIKKTKIIATIGPASSSEKIVKSMILNGTDMFRLNASHNSEPEQIKNIVTLIRKIAKKENKHVSIFMDLQGPKIRVGKIEGGSIDLKLGQQFSLTSTERVGNKEGAFVSYKGFENDVVLGDPIFIDDGKIRLKVLSKTKKEVLCKVERAGVLSNYKGVNLPLTKMSVSPFTDKDKKDALIAINNNVDYIALSFVCEKKDIVNFRNFLKKNEAENIQIIAKIERQAAIDNLEDIINFTDAVMVARGDLGVEVGIEKVPKLQKSIIRKCNSLIKPVIVATQMLESMIQSEVATRAEVSDVANAVYDHCDAVMLSGETAIGINPPNVIKTMSSICMATDKHMLETRIFNANGPRFDFEKPTVATSFCKAADQVAEENNATAIMAFTSSGNTPLIASKFNPKYPIIAPTDRETICARMALYKGVIPMMMPKKFNQISRWMHMIEIAGEEAIKLGLLEKGDTIVVTAGVPIGQSNGINSIRIYTV